MTHGYRNVFAEERVQVFLFQTGNAIFDAVLTDWFFGSQGTNIVAQGIASAFAAGAPSIILPLGATSIVSAEAEGSPSILLVLSPTGLVTGEALGSPGAVLVLQPSGIATGQAFGEPAAVLVLSPSGIASGLEFGAADLSVYVYASGIDGAEAFGEPSVSAGIFLVAVGIASDFAAGTPTVTRDYIITRVVRDRNKLPVYGANCYLFVTYSKQFVDQTTTDSTGRYVFHVANTADSHFVVTFKDGTPPLAGVTWNVLVGT